jgi:uncharacterized membrane protein
MSGHCPVYGTFGYSTAPEVGGIVLHSAVTVDASRENVFRRWREFAQHPKFSSRVEAAEATAEGRTRWTFRVPLIGDRQWETETVQEAPGERLAWRTVPGSEIHQHGVAEFLPAPGGRGTEVHVTVLIRPPLGPLGRVVGRMVRRIPKEWLETELLRFKQWIETGEVADVEGQPSGEHSS